MDRFVLTDAQWAKMQPLCLGKPGDPGRSGKDNRLFVEAVLWIARTGSPWRDLPPSFGHWNSVFTRFRDWVKADSCWLAKNMTPVSMIVNSNAKNTGATSANSTAAEPRPLRRNRRQTCLAEAVEAARDGIEESPRSR